MFISNVKEKLSMATVALAFLTFEAVLSPGHAQAATITSTLPEFSGEYFDGSASFPLSSVTVGTFSYTIPSGEQIVSASLSGTFGNSVVSNSSGLNLLLDGLQVAQCIRFDTCYYSATPEAFNFTFSPADLSLLNDGSALLTAIQTSEYVIRLGSTTLTIETASVPESGTILGTLTVAGFSLALRRRQKWQQTDTIQA
ncbi:PEP-CTERM sorting domain-containing protein [Nostoc sp. CENA67]|uniref:PEP-CTERM sorting domain-containing protein n=1 Tax=Amazonocrinis nigriterrae CENA67 TaxID=2794033 RepID=A0A8J7L616_9NOST|nr:PEP-CTERM sorting domain-containing protein [Amazonocrinis nigriterrae]MBH8560635.1 PEP-CTERM sorting domain-containing protein [Amazonocrinis nigriterrae CENA67]